MEDICIIIRVFNRIDDLHECVQIIRDTWTKNRYHIIVVSNGKASGFFVQKDTLKSVDTFVELEQNAGHLKGNAQLLLEGIPFIPDNCKHTIILEADTWIYSDYLIEKYIAKIKKRKALWASAQWYASLYSLATDFAIIDTSFLASNRAIFNFERFPEYYVANYLKKAGHKPIYITEIAPINLPTYLKNFPYTLQGRFCLFPKACMVTHHLENLKGGINEKKTYFNTVVNKQYFDIPKQVNGRLFLYKFKLFISLYYLIPHKSWFMIKREKDLI